MLDFIGQNINPQIVEQYIGGYIVLENGDEILSLVMFSMLHKLIGHTIITTDGKTLRDADDKAGLAEIVTAMGRLKEQNIPHGTIRIAFKPDEEVGKGTQFSISCALAPNGPIPWTAAMWASLSTKSQRRLGNCEDRRQ